MAAPQSKTLKPTSRTQQPARRRVVARLWQTAERQVAEIEARLGAGVDAATLERDAKTFALIARTVRELVALDSDALASAKEKCRVHASQHQITRAEAAADDDGFGARDIEDFRAELARRLAALRAEGTAETPA